jgi:hypothetical protein
VLDRHGHIILRSLLFVFSRYRMVVILILSLLLIRGLTLIQNDLGGATVTMWRPLDLAPQPVSPSLRRWFSEHVPWMVPTVSRCGFCCLVYL